jgi:uncharacterized protein YjbI with pentapeptide repeats
MATCRIDEIHIIYWGLKCSREAWGQDPEGLCLLHSRQTDKDKDGAFTVAVRTKLQSEDYDFGLFFFPGPFSLKDLTGQDSFIFTKSANFTKASFQERASFSRATFQGASFSGATFLGEANFSGTTFQEGVDFFAASFQRADFARATFHEANFPFATFHEADFSWATFHEASFIEASFQEWAAFARATFQGTSRFVGIEPKKEGFAGDFQLIMMDQEASLLFQNTNLSRVLFGNTDLRRLIFRNVDWHPYHHQAAEFFLRSLLARWQSWLRGRQAVYDEILLRKKRQEDFNLFQELVQEYGWKVARQNLTEGMPDSYARVEELYRGLKQNYEKDGDYKRVGDFHYGEMEMHRLASPWRRWTSWYSLYWALNGYGERPLRALFVLVGFIFALPAVVWVLGTESYLNTLIFIIEKAALQRTEWPQGITWGRRR